MTKKVAVIVIHGIGSQNPDFAEEMIGEMNKRIFDLSKNPNEIAWKPIYWAEIYLRRNSLDISEMQREIMTLILSD